MKKKHCRYHFGDYISPVKVSELSNSKCKSNYNSILYCPFEEALIQAGAIKRQKPLLNERILKLAETLYPHNSMRHKSCVKKIKLLPRRKGYLWFDSKENTTSSIVRCRKPGEISMKVKTRFQELKRIKEAEELAKSKHLQKMMQEKEMKKEMMQKQKIEAIAFEEQKKIDSDKKKREISHETHKKEKMVDDHQCRHCDALRFNKGEKKKVDTKEKKKVDTKEKKKKKKK